MKYPNHLLLDLNTSVSKTLIYSCNDEKIKLFKRHAVLSSTNFPIEKVTLPVPNQHILNQDMTGISNIQYDKTILSIFDIHFLRKEKLYTKLKYSRCPQYDIVSGGFAALLAGYNYIM